MGNKVEVETKNIFAHDPTSARYDTKRAAEFLGIAPQTLEIWRCTKRNEIPFIRVGSRAIRYRECDLKAFLERGLVDAGGR